MKKEQDWNLTTGGSIILICSKCHHIWAPEIARGDVVNGTKVCYYGHRSGVRVFINAFDIPGSFTIDDYRTLVFAFDYWKEQWGHK